MFTETISYQAALIAGLLSFFSPCILPLIPAYFSFITGLSVDELTKDSKKTRQKVIITTLVYVSGFSFIFILLGASASFLGGFVSQYTYILRYIGGGIILILGLHLLGIINIKILNFEKRVHYTKKPIHLFGVFIIGMAFGAGWSPCIGPMLGSILIVAGNQETIVQGILLLSVYSAGLALPFILLSFFVNRIFEIMRHAAKALFYINKTAGLFLVVLGILLITDKFRILAGL
ncbi:cytochrome c biogenesis protein CcdA [Desulfobacula sp.]|uniref:cytochrome c biogenesis CcdA family protein n=1 Tax=Desulfobacula sp. TaxID=2593537 RepID=UPI0025C189B3|nr:cytochrome c biogenesis protein CcdA [Desulfobacula sp.]MBC2704466.1 cytochrome c biogenesis protein CcdA [Desulfobacula sp.]